MPWFHVQWSSFASWLPGDPRGFRNHQHRVHSSGDYKHPPPEGEHALLHHYATQVQRGAPVWLDAPARALAGAAILDKAEREGVLIVALAVNATHVHVLLRTESDRLPDQLAGLKRHSSHALRPRKPEGEGRVWAARWHVTPVRNREHQVNTYRYILDHGCREQAWTWGCKPEDRAAWVPRGGA